jgi:hypothetical protein
MNTSNPDVGKYEEITELITDLLRNSKSHDRFTLDELRALTECYIMLKRKRDVATNTHNKSLFSRGAEMKYKYQEERLAAHATLPPTLKVVREEVPQQVIDTIADYAGIVMHNDSDWSDTSFSEDKLFSTSSDSESSESSDNLTKSVIISSSGKLPKRKLAESQV